MSEEKRRFRLGLFVISGIVLAGAGVVAISAGRLFKRTQLLCCYFQESVQGLEPGSPVKFRGVEVGRVDTINVMPASRIAAVADAPLGTSLIEVLSSLEVSKISDQTTSLVDTEQLDASIAREVSQGLRVRIAWKDITGQKYLDLDYVDPKLSPPPALPMKPPGSYIPTAVEKSFSDIQRDVATVTSQLAELDYKAIVAEVRGLVGSLRARVDALDTLKIGGAADAVRDLASGPKVDEVLTRLSATLARIESVSGRLDELLATPSLPAALDDFAASAASMRRITADLGETLPKLTRSLDETLALARRTIAESNVPETTAAARAAMADLGGAARQFGALRESARHTLAGLDGATRGLADLVKYLEENPDALIHGKTEASR